MYYLSIFIILLSLGSTSLWAQSTTRSEISRYTLLRDRTILDRDLKREPYAHFFEADIYASSGTKSLVGDIKAGSEGQNPNGTSNVLAIINREVNSERYLDIDVLISSPLPYLKVKKFRLLPSFFVHQNLGASVSISNQQSITDPLAQVYVKADRKIGVHSRVRWKQNEEWRFSLYQMSRIDVFASKNSAAISTDEKLFEFPEFDNSQSTFNLDVAFIKDEEKYRWMVEMKELKLVSSSDVTTPEPSYGNRALMHAQFMYKKENSSGSKYYHFVGLHQRKSYSLFEGMYVGTRFKGSWKVPVEFTGKLSNQFFTFIPQIKFKWFEFSYSLKLAYINPQDDIWTPAIHSVNLRIPFP